MRGKIEYISAESRGENGGAILLEQALIEEFNVQVLFAIVCDEHSSREWKLINDAGEWFQNKAIPLVLKGLQHGEGAEDIINIVLDNKCDFVSGNMSAALILGEVAAFVSNSITGDIYLSMNQFGIRRLVKLIDTMYDLSDEKRQGIIRLEPGISILLSSKEPGDMAPDIASEMAIASTESELGRLCNEITEAIGEETSVVCVRML